MSFNLALILVVLTGVSGVVVAFNRFYYEKRIAETGEVPPEGLALLIEYSRSFFPVLLFVLVIRSFIFEPFRIPSGSMMPTLVQGDYIFVKKFSYGLRLPVLETKFFETGNPERGDVVVFRLPKDPSINYIKRVVGLPGDEIVYRNHRLFINGELQETTTNDRVEIKGLDLYYDGEFVMTMTEAGPGEQHPNYRGEQPYTENLDGIVHSIFLRNSAPGGYTLEYRVPDAHYFMMGDNRDNSSDSRVIGFVPETHLVGEAVLIWMHMDGVEWPNWRRIGTSIE